MADERGLPPGSAEVILDSLAEGVFTVDRTFRVTSFNRAAERMTGVPREKALGSTCCEVFRADLCERCCALRRTFSEGVAVMNFRVVIRGPAGVPVPVAVSTATLRGADGEVLGGVETFRDLSVEDALRREVEERHAAGDLETRNPRMQALLDLVPEVAASDASVLLQGESGTGKELVARALHRTSRRAAGPLVVVNTAALPDSLVEAELFGHVAGAFTDARGARPGRFARAHGGTLFLDEVADMSPALQVRLLRVLQDGVYEPLGSTQPEHADVRLLAATNRDLLEEVRAGRFRADLYYRMAVVTMTLVPLRERPEDVPLLADRFLATLAALRGREPAGFTADALACLVAYPWPGNVRELRNVVEYASIQGRGAPVEPSHLPRAVGAAAGAAVPSGLSLADIEARAIHDALARHGGRRLAAARELGIDKTTLWRKLRRLAAPPPEVKRP